MATKITDAAQNAAVDAVVDLFDAGAGAATLKIYTGTAPADADTAPTGTLLVTITLNDPAFGAASAGVSTMDNSPVPSGVAIAAGDAGYFLIEDSNGLNVMTGSITATAGGGDLELDNISIAVDQTVNITALTASIPASE